MYHEALRVPSFALCLSQSGTDVFPLLLFVYLNLEPTWYPFTPSIAFFVDRSWSLKERGAEGCRSSLT